MATSSLDPAAALRRAGLRVTASRLAVLAALAAGAPHASVDAIVSAVRERLGDSSAQSVYNVLHTFTEVGLVRRIEPAGQPGLYELRVGDNHHHVVCRRCGAIADIACAVGDAPCLTAADDCGYEIDEAEIIFWGRCPRCIAATAVSSGGRAQADAARDPPGDAAEDPAQPPSTATRHQTEPPREEKDRRA